MNGDLLEDLVNLEEEIREENERNPRNPRDVLIENENDNNAIIKRNDIVNVLPIRQRP